ncbi:hypothetical protein RclHR1_15040009 [Rhizophagus clarus]|uniref:Uncharacterized protein n=2 Tax=Rhizophagus clarus TaxID=94130 RepID=A0A2Z6QE84_9GLOM|nr:hypothetical protein RclHR1_15040009 [Rhizophagus clarus]
MSTESTCNFNSTDCKGIIRPITNNTKIPITQKEFILVGMKLCQTHYNKFIVNETHSLKYNEICSHLKHDEYQSQSKNPDKKSKNFNLRKVPKRLISILNLDETAKICSLCRKKTDSDPDYNMLEEYNAPISRKKNDSDNILKVGNHTYSFRKDVLYTGEELKQFESDYQEIITQLTIIDEISLSGKIKKMSNILYKNQRILGQKTIYDPDEFKNMLEIEDADLIGFFDELYQGTNPNTKSDKTNNNNKKKLKKVIINILKFGNNIYLMIHMKINGIFTIHDYDERIQNQQELRSMKNSKLVDFILHSLHNTKDYIESANILFATFEKIEQEDYLNNFVISTICDWPGQINLRRAITLRLNEKDNSGIPSQILSLIPMIKPFHVSLNSRETLFQIYHFFFKMIYHNLFGENKILVQKPKPRLIDLILNLTFYGWKNICNLIINRFKNIKDIEYLILIDLLDNSLPLILEIYAKLFRCGFYKGYLEGIVRIWVLFQRLQRHNYNKASLIFLSDVFYWTINKHPIIDILKNNLPIFNDYFVENFHSSLRYQTAESNTEKQIIQKAKIIDIERNDEEFKSAFINTRNTKISKVKLISLEKKVSLILLSLFDEIYHNIGKTKNNNNETFELPSFNNKIVDIRVLPLAWSTSNLPDEEKICDAENCNITNSSSNIVLICGHSYHKECLSFLNEKCEYYFNYLSKNIKTNIISLNKRSFKSLNDDKIAEITKNNNDLDDDYEDENVETLLEETEENIDNQYEIQYNIWLNYNNNM